MWRSSSDSIDRKIVGVTSSPLAAATSHIWTMSGLVKAASATSWRLTDIWTGSPERAWSRTQLRSGPKNGWAKRNLRKSVKPAGSWYWEAK